MIPCLIFHNFYLIFFVVLRVLVTSCLRDCLGVHSAFGPSAGSSTVNGAARPGFTRSRWA